MTEQELRALVRETIAAVRPAAASQAPGQPGRRPDPHASHFIYPLSAGADTDGPCIIEPAVTCNHCGYCKSHGY